MTLTTTLIIIACAFSTGFVFGAMWKGLFQDVNGALIGALEEMRLAATCQFAANSESATPDVRARADKVLTGALNSSARVLAKAEAAP